MPAFQVATHSENVCGNDGPYNSDSSEEVERLPRDVDAAERVVRRLAACAVVSSGVNASVLVLKTDGSLSAPCLEDSGDEGAVHEPRRYEGDQVEVEVAVVLYDDAEHRDGLRLRGYMALTLSASSSARRRASGKDGPSARTLRWRIPIAARMSGGWG